MGKIGFAWDDNLLYSGVAITASSANAAFPGSNVGTAQPGEVWRSVDGITTANLLFDLGTARVTTAVYLGSANLSSAATWRSRVSTVDATGAAGNAYDSGVVAMGINAIERCMYKIIGAITGRYVRIDLVDATLTLLEVGKVALMVNSWRPAFNFAMGARWIGKDFSITRDGLDGQRRVRRGSIREGLVFTLPIIPTAEQYASLRPLTRHAGNSRDIVVCMDPEDPTDIGAQTCYGALEEFPENDRFMTKFGRVGFRIWKRI